MRARRWFWRIMINHLSLFLEAEFNICVRKGAGVLKRKTRLFDFRKPLFIVFRVHPFLSEPAQHGEICEIFLYVARTFVVRIDLVGIFDQISYRLKPALRQEVGSYVSEGGLGRRGIKKMGFTERGCRIGVATLLDATGPVLSSGTVSIICGIPVRQGITAG